MPATSPRTAPFRRATGAYWWSDEDGNHVWIKKIGRRWDVITRDDTGWTTHGTHASLTDALNQARTLLPDELRR